MKITVDIPDGTICGNLCIVYRNRDFGMSMAADMYDTEDLKKGETFYLPRERGKRLTDPDYEGDGK